MIIAPIETHATTQPSLPVTPMPEGGDVSPASSPEANARWHGRRSQLPGHSLRRGAGMDGPLALRLEVTVVGSCGPAQTSSKG